METIIIRYMDLPCKFHGFVRRDAEGDYNIYINSKLSFDMQQKTIEHEVSHIENGDFDSESDIREVEGL